MDSIKKLLPLLLALLFAGMAAFSLAQTQQRQSPGSGATERKDTLSVNPRYPGSGMGMGMGMDSMCMNNIHTYLSHADDLKLTDQQVQQLRNRQTQYMQNSIQSRAKLQTGMVNLCGAMDDPNMNMTQIRQRIQEYQSSLGDHMTQMAQAQVDARNILSASQRQQALRYETSGMCAMMGMGKAIPDSMRETMPGMTAPRSTR